MSQEKYLGSMTSVMHELGEVGSTSPITSLLSAVRISKFEATYLASILNEVCFDIKPDENYFAQPNLLSLFCYSFKLNDFGNSCHK